MIIYIDENTPPSFAQGFEIIQRPLFKRLELAEEVEVKSIRDVFGSGTEDEEWIPMAGSEGACVITRDQNINRIKQQRALCEQYGLGMIFIKPPKKKGISYWELAELLVKRWPEILEVVTREERPFFYELTPRAFRKLP